MKKYQRLCVFILLVAAFLSACSGGKRSPTPEATPTEFPIVLTATALAEQIQNPPTALPPDATQQAPEVPVEAQLHAQIVFWAPEDVDATQAQGYFDQLSKYADQNGVTLERRSTLEASQLSTDVQVVVSMATAPAIHTIAPAVQYVQFLAVGGGEVPTGGNVHAVSSAGVNVAQRAFLAGYILALTTTDYRVGVISQADTAEGAATRNGFVTGAQYYCGICNSRYAPILFYPMNAEVSDPANQAGWQTAVDALLAQAVTAVFVQPEISTPDLMSYLEGKNVRVVVVDGQPGGDGANAVALLSSGGTTDLTPALDELLVGRSVGTMTTSISIVALNQGVLTQGKFGLVERVKSELLAGEINPTRQGQ